MVQLVCLLTVRAARRRSLCSRLHQAWTRAAPCSRRVIMMRTTRSLQPAALCLQPLPMAQVRECAKTLA